MIDYCKNEPELVLAYAQKWVRRIQRKDFTLKEFRTYGSQRYFHDSRERLYCRLCIKVSAGNDMLLWKLLHTRTASV